MKFPDNLPLKFALLFMVTYFSDRLRVHFTLGSNRLLWCKENVCKFVPTSTANTAAIFFFPKNTLTVCYTDNGQVALHYVNLMA